MYQRLDFFDWSQDQAYSVHGWLIDASVLEDAEIITELDGVAHGFFEFTDIASDEVEYLAANWEEIVHVKSIPGSNKLDIYELCFHFHDLIDLSNIENDDSDKEDD
jgi:hypothetical protein